MYRLTVQYLGVDVNDIWQFESGYSPRFAIPELLVFFFCSLLIYTLPPDFPAPLAILLLAHIASRSFLKLAFFQKLAFLDGRHSTCQVSA